MQNFLKYTCVSFVIIALSSCVMSDENYNAEKKIEVHDVYENEKTGDRLYIKDSKTAVKPKAKGDARVALILPLAGNDAHLGRHMLDSTQLALYELQSNNIHLVPIDSSHGAKYIEERLKSEKPDIILGPIYSSDAKEIYPFAKENNICMITFSNDDDISGQDCVFLMGVMPQESVKRIAQYSHNKGLSDVNAVLPTTKYGKVVEGELAKFNKDSKDQVKIIGRYNENNLDQDIKQITSNINQYAKNSTTVLFPDGGENLQRFIKGVRGQKYGKKVKYLGSGFWEDQSLLKVPELTGAWFASAPKEDRDLFDQRFQDNFGYKPSSLASLAYDGIALISSISKNGLDREGLNKAAILNPNGFRGVTGIFRFNADGTNERSMAVYEIRKDGFLEVDPAPLKFAQVQHD